MLQVRRWDLQKVEVNLHGLGIFSDIFIVIVIMFITSNMLKVSTNGIHSFYATHHFNTNHQVLEIFCLMLTPSNSAEQSELFIAVKVLQVLQCSKKST